MAPNVAPLAASEHQLLSQVLARFARCGAWNHFADHSASASAGAPAPASALQASMAQCAAGAERGFAFQIRKSRSEPATPNGTRNIGQYDQLRVVR
jgi:hypothetical protein